MEEGEPSQTRFGSGSFEKGVSKIETSYRAISDSSTPILFQQAAFEILRLSALAIGGPAAFPSTPGSFTPLASATFTAPSSSADIRVALPVTLGPGYRSEESRV